jgi:acylglycerol lipase
MSSLRTLERPGEPKITWQLDAPTGKARGSVLLVHGFADHSARYERVVDLWVARGLAVGRLDLRGHGRSEGPRGHVDSFSDYVRDVTAVLDALGREPEWQAGKKPVLFGHSMGGLVTAHTTLSLGDRVAGLALTSPFFGLAKPVPALQRVLASVAGRLAPQLKQPSGLKGSDCTHDVEIARAYDADPLGFKFVRAGWFLEIMQAHRELFASASRFRLPLFCIAAGEDRLVSTPATERFFAVAGSQEKELDVRPGLFHEVLNEPDWQAHASRLADRMLRWVAP